jgi:hypothetical protein
MPQISRSVDTARPPGEVFTLTNDIRHRLVLSGKHDDVEALRRKDARRCMRLVFQLRNREGAGRQPCRTPDHQDLVAVTQQRIEEMIGSRAVSVTQPTTGAAR